MRTMSPAPARKTAIQMLKPGLDGGYRSIPVDAMFSHCLSFLAVTSALSTVLNEARTGDLDPPGRC